MNKKIVLIGVGNVGASYAYALLNQRTPVNELVLIDVNKDKALGEAMDLNHSLAFAPSKMKIRVGDYKDVEDANIVCITAGKNQNKGESRIELFNINKKIIEEIVDNVMKYNFKGIFLIATNPLDAITKVVYDKAKVKESRVIGSGTSLDTSRLRFLIGEKLEINPENVHAYVIGEHGDSEFVPWSNVTVGLQKINAFLNEREMEQIYVDVRDAAYKIIKCKGATYYGIGMCLVKITNAILGDENTIITVSAFDKENNIFISTPTIINREGASHKIYIDLNELEKNKMENSIEVIKKAIDLVEK